MRLERSAPCYNCIQVARFHRENTFDSPHSSFYSQANLDSEQRHLYNASESKIVSSGFSEGLEEGCKELLKLSWAFIFRAQPRPHTSVRQGFILVMWRLLSQKVSTAIWWLGQEACQNFLWWWGHRSPPGLAGNWRSPVGLYLQLFAWWQAA